MTTPSPLTAPPPPPGTSIRPRDLSEDDRARAAGPRPTPSRKRAVLAAVRETTQLVVVALLMAFLIKSIALQAFYIPSGSMLETLQIGDRVLVEKITYRVRDPQRGEIMVFRRPGLEEDGFSVGRTVRSFLEGIGLSEPDEDRDLIKRIIGLPGETVELIGGVVHVNGMPLDESVYAAPESRDFPPTVVPEGEYYVLGDNRGNSRDSRLGLGTIPRDNVIGRAFVIIWPLGDATFRLDEDYPGVGETPLPPTG